MRLWEIIVSSIRLKKINRPTVRLPAFGGTEKFIEWAKKEKLSFWRENMKNWIYNHAFTSSIIGGIVYFLIAFWIEQNFWEKYNSLNLQNFILFATSVAIIWYSLETRLLKNATNIANAIQAEPFLVLQYRKKENKDELYIANYGKGIAFNIKMEIKNIQSFFNFSITDTNSLGHSEEKSLSLGNYQENQNITAEITLLFDKSEGDKIVQRVRRYQIQKITDGWQINFLG